VTVSKDTSEKFGYIRDFLSERLESIPTWVLDDLECLEQAIESQDARIAELERCVVMGGDGKPIGYKSVVFTRDSGDVYQGHVDQIYETAYGELYLSVFVHQGEAPSAKVRIKKPVKSCYSSPDQVPEGGK